MTDVIQLHEKDVSVPADDHRLSGLLEVEQAVVDAATAWELSLERTVRAGR